MLTRKGPADVIEETERKTSLGASRGPSLRAGSFVSRNVGEQSRKSLLGRTVYQREDLARIRRRSPDRQVVDLSMEVTATVAAQLQRLSCGCHARPTRPRFRAPQLPIDMQSPAHPVDHEGDVVPKAIRDETALKPTLWD